MLILNYVNILEEFNCFDMRYFDVLVMLIIKIIKANNRISI